MSPEEFDRLLHQGSGRAVLYLQQHDATPYREVILHACTRSIVFDRQCEGSRAEYLFEIVQLTGEAQFYRDAIFQAVNTLLENFESQEDNDYRLLQLFALVRLFAQQGDVQAREFMYEAFHKYTWTDALGIATPGWEEFVELDGLDGFLFVLGYLEGLSVPAEEWIDEYRVWTVVGRFGAEAVNQALEQACEQKRLSKEYLVQIQEYMAPLDSDESETSKTRASIDRSYAGFREALEQKNRPPWSRWRFFMRWGRAASDEALLRVAQELLLEDDPQRLFYYLAAFRLRRFPLAPDRLLALVESSDPMIADAALHTLQHIEHLAVRTLALRLLNIKEDLWWLPVGKHADDPFEYTYASRVSYALDLLETNYQPGDHILIEAALNQASERARAGQYNADELHSLGFGLQGICEKHLSADLIGALMIMYHWEPCSMCRESLVQCLLDLDALPKELVEECRYDSRPEIRELVANLHNVSQ